jgi:site-specific recombinase XerC
MWYNRAMKDDADLVAVPPVAPPPASRFADWQMHLRAERRLADATLHAYATDVRAFLTFLDDVATI